MPFNPVDRNGLTFPGRDQKFGSLVGQFGELTANPHADNLVSNEDSYPRVAAEIAKRVRPGLVYLGVGPDQNFTLMAHARPSVAFVVDFRRRNLLLHLLHKAFFAIAADRHAYLRALTSRDPDSLPGNSGLSELVRRFSASPFDLSRRESVSKTISPLLRTYGVVTADEWAVLSSIQSKLAGPGLNLRFLALPMYPTLGQLIATTDREGQLAHFVSRDNLYEQVRELQVGDRVVPVVGDFAGKKTFQGIGSWLRERRLRVGLIYASDVEFFLIRAGKLYEYVANLCQLPWSTDAVIVRTSTREIDHPERVAGDSSTTVVRDAARFLARARAGRIRNVDDLFVAD